MFLSCWAYAQSVEDLNGCIYQVNEEEDDQDVDYDSEEADEEDDYDSEEADEDVDYDSEEADEEDDDDYLEVCAARLDYIGEAYSNVDEGVRQDFES